MKPPTDHLAPRRSFDANGSAPPERLSEFFDFQRFPEKAERKVKRMELLAILTSIEKNRWHRRAWRWLMRQN